MIIFILAHFYQVIHNELKKDISSWLYHSCT